MRIPLATYRFQFHRGFTFAQARELLPYLRELGISDVYASPIFLAGPESTHGYDICGFDQINPNVGTEQEFEEFANEIRELEMGLLVDMVPNHMGSHASNCWWTDVLRNGPHSKFATYFDIEWNPPNTLLHGKVLLPVLGDHYAAVLERGELQVIFEEDEFKLAYFDKRFPISPRILEALELTVQVSPAALQEKLRKLNGTAGEAKSFDGLHALVESQHYRLAYWRVGPHEINYRRFFDVTELVSVRVEDELVFNASHAFLLELLRAGKVTGLRIDHPDGLRDPKTYFQRLQGGAENDLYVLAEKILSDDERLAEDWPIHGTTGYDYLNYLNGLFVRPENEEAFTAIYRRFTDSGEDFESLAFRSKQDVLNRMFISEVNTLTDKLKRIAARTRYGHDSTEADLRTAIIDFIAGFPVYRTYVTESSESISAEEKEFLRRGLEEAKRRTKMYDTRALEFLVRILSLEWFGDFREEEKMEAREFILRFQQLSGPATAKGLEDTAFYRYTRFVSLNEVGGHPGRFGITAEEFHEYNHYKQQKWPHSMLASSTHDTKRGEDTRAQLNVLSEIPAEWDKQILEWRTMNEALKRERVPAPADEYLLYQVIVGTWTPDADISEYIERLQKYILKAIREAKVHTAWTEPNENYENGTAEFVGAILTSEQFVQSMAEFAEEIAYFGMLNSLAQVVLKTCSPGVPDFYQGTELWDLTLVDPDNRRPVDYTLRQAALKGIQNKTPAALLKDWRSAAIKLFTMTKALRIRNEHAAITNGDYQALTVAGEKREHVIAFARSSVKSTILVAVPRFIRTLTDGKQTFPGDLWEDTCVEFSGAKRFRNLLTGEEFSGLAAGELFKTFPAAILLPLD